MSCHHTKIFALSKKYTILFGIILLVAAVYSCAVPHKLQRAFTIRYDGKRTNLDSLLDIRGYYTIKIPTSYPLHSKPFSKKDSIVYDTLYLNYLFFDDGMFLCYMYCVGCSKPGCMPEKLKEYANDPVAKKNNSFGGNWGAYSVNKDTIRTQFISKINLRKPSWEATEIDFKIIDKHTLVVGNSKPLYPVSKTITENYKRNALNHISRTASLVPANIIPDSDCWLKKEKWFLKCSSVNVQ